MKSPGRRFLVLGLDGGTFDLLDPLMAAGELPFLSGLSGHGFTAPLTSVFPPKTIPAWYSFATGLDPGTLGIFGFTEPDGSRGRSRLVQTFRPAEAIWDTLSRQGHSVGVLNFPLGAGYPVHGFFVPGMFADAPQTYPADVGRRLGEMLGEPYLPELPPYRPADREGWMGLANHAVDQRGRLAEMLIAKYKPDFLFVLFRETDRVEHQHWAELSQPVAAIPTDLRTFWRGVDRACDRIEAAFRAVGGPAVSLVISDHGHGAAGTEFFTNRWLQEQGYLRLQDGGLSWRRRLVSRSLVALDRFGPARKLLHPVVARIQGGPRREQIAQFMAGDSSFEAVARRIDWKRSVAFSYPVPEAIYLNPDNPELTPARRTELLAEIRHALENYPEAKIEVLEPKEIYRSVRGDPAPDLFVKVNELETETRMDFTYPHAMLPRRPGYFYGSGVHRMDGVLFAAGAGVPARGRLGRKFSLLDIAPTVLEGMMAPVVPSMPGRSFAPLLGTAPT